jgi:hypothetical protein
MRPALLGVAIALALVASSPADAKATDDWLGDLTAKVVKDIAAGKPLVVEVHVPLCQTGILRVRSSHTWLSKEERCRIGAAAPTALKRTSSFAFQRRRCIPDLCSSESRLRSSFRRLIGSRVSRVCQRHNLRSGSLLSPKIGSHCVRF